MAKKSKRRGRMRPGGAGEPAVAMAGAPAAGPIGFDADAWAQKFGLWWMNGDGENFIRETPSGWIMLQGRAVQDEAQIFFEDAVSFVPRAEDYGVSQWRRVLSRVRTSRRVEEILKGLAGYPAGPHRVGGDQVLVKTGRVLPLPRAGVFPIIRELIDSRMSRVRHGERLEFDQCLLFDLWCKVAYESQRDCKPGMPRRGHALVLVGENGSGKSFLQQHLITPLLGGREADPKMFLQGNDAYNSDVLGAEHLALGELAMPSAKLDARNELKERLKALIANTHHRMRCMRTEPLTVAPNWAFSHSLNGNHDSLRNYPGLEPGFRDKILMLLIVASPMPMPTRTESERSAFRDTIMAELPAYVDYLTNLEIPETLKVYKDTGADATRFGFREFQHGSLVSQLFEDTQQAQLKEMIDSAWFERKVLFDGKHSRVQLWDLPSPGNAETKEEEEAAALGDVNVSRQKGVWMGSHQWLRSLLLGDHEDWTCTVHREFEKWLRYNPVPANLARLQEEEGQVRFESVSPVPRLTRRSATGTRRMEVRCWRIARPIE